LQIFTLWLETKNSDFSYFYSNLDFEVKIAKLYSFPANFVRNLYYLKEQGNDTYNYLHKEIFKSLETLDTSVGLFIENDIDLQL